MSSSWSSLVREGDGTETLNKFHVWAVPGSYLSAERLIVAIMQPWQRYDGLETVADLARKGIAYTVIPLDGTGWTAAGFPCNGEMEEDVVRYVPVPLETLVP